MILRKRTVSGERECFNLTTVNSAFLSGLFADVAQVQEEKEASEKVFAVFPQAPLDDPRLDEALVIKKESSLIDSIHQSLQQVVQVPC